MIKALDHCGKLVLGKEPFSVQEAWFIVKNDKSSNVRTMSELQNYSVIWKAKSLFGCKYDDAVESVVADLASNLYIKSAHRTTGPDC